MAQDTLAENGLPMNPAGMNDNTPLEEELNWYQTRGIHSLSDKCLQRCNGKLLAHKFDSPVLGIHGELQNRVYIETASTLYMFESLADPIPTEDVEEPFMEIPIAHDPNVAPLDYFDLAAIDQTFKSLRIEGFFRCYNTDFDDVLSNLQIFLNGNFDDTSYYFSSIEDGVHTKGLGAPNISKSSVYGAHKLIIDIPMYSNVNAFPTVFARSGIQNGSGDFLLRDSAVRSTGSTGAITDIRIKTTVERLEFVGRMILT